MDEQCGVIVTLCWLCLLHVMHSACNVGGQPDSTTLVGTCTISMHLFIFLLYRVTFTGLNFEPLKTLNTLVSFRLFPLSLPVCPTRFFSLPLLLEYKRPSPFCRL